MFEVDIKHDGRRGRMDRLNSLGFSLGYNTTPYNTLRFSIVLYSTELYSSVQYSIEFDHGVQYNSVV